MRVSVGPLRERSTSAPLLSPGNVRVSIWGQSNAQGRALRSDISTSPLSGDPGLATFDAGTFARVWIWTGSQYDQLQPAVNNQTTSGQFGPEFGLAVRWMRETSSGNLYLHKGATGSGLSIDPYFEPGQYDRYQYEKAQEQAGDAALSGGGITLAAKGWLWVQGEQDAGQSQSWYQTRLEALVAALLSDSLLSSSSPMVIAQMKVGSATYDANIAAAKAAVVAADASHRSAVALDYMQGDNIHCTARGQVQLGYDAFELLFGATHIAA